MIPNMQNIYGFMNGFRGFMQNPAQAIMQSKIGVPQQFANDPDKVIQYLMDSGKISQAQYNQAKQIADQMKSNPAIMKMLVGK